MHGPGSYGSTFRTSFHLRQRRFIDWIVSGHGVQTPDVQAHLLQHSLLNTTTLVMLLLSTVMISAVAIARTGEAWAYAWLLAELLIGWAKISFQFHVDKDSALANTEKATGPIVASLAGCLVLGIAGYQCVMSGDPLLILLSGICLGGLVGGTSVRTAGTPRFAMILMSLMVLPYTLATLISPIPYLFLIGVLMPLLLGGMFVVLQQDYNTLVGLFLAQRENRWLAYHDILTGLPNRTMELKCFDDLLRNHDGVEIEGLPLFMVFCLDLDGFKDVNDSFGHEAGDAVLVIVAKRLRNCIRDVDFLFRVGGDEFVVLLPAITPGDAAAIAERIIGSITRPIDIGRDVPFQIGISIGSARAIADGATADELLRSADAAMYEAKRRGKGIYVTLPFVPEAVDLAPRGSAPPGPVEALSTLATLHFPLPLQQNPV